MLGGLAPVIQTEAVYCGDKIGLLGAGTRGNIFLGRPLGIKYKYDWDVWDSFSFSCHFGFFVILNLINPHFRNHKILKYETIP